MQKKRKVSATNAFWLIYNSMFVTSMGLRVLPGHLFAVSKLSFDIFSHQFSSDWLTGVRIRRLHRKVCEPQEKNEQLLG